MVHAHNSDGVLFLEFREQIQKDPKTKCELWTGNVDDEGFGIFSVYTHSNRQNAIHLPIRVINLLWSMSVGKVDKFAHLGLRCGNRRCCALYHIQMVDKSGKPIKGDAE